jgi:RNA polymerase sigma-70 factor, ECF subfamily
VSISASIESFPTAHGGSNTDAERKASPYALSWIAMKGNVVSDKTSLGNAVLAQVSGAKHSADSVERELIVRITNGNRSAMAKLYLLYFPRLAKFFSHMMGNATAIEELISDTMVELWRENATIGPNTRVSVWVMGIAYRHARKRLADLASSRPHKQPSALRTNDTPQSWTVEALQHLDDYLRRLTVEERAALSLVYGGDHSRQDVVSIMNMSRESVEMHLNNARLWLRSAAEDNGIAHDEGGEPTQQSDGCVGTG